MHLNSSRSLSLGVLKGDIVEVDRLLQRAGSNRGFSVLSSSESDCGDKRKIDVDVDVDVRCESVWRV
jgi:hypothetical protein